MRKHFLLLFLMAILPLAGWAAILQPSDVVAESPYFGNLPTYTGAAVTAGGVEVVGYYDNEGCTGTALTEAQVKATKATTTLYVKFNGVNGYEGVQVKSFQIKAMPLVLKAAPGTKKYGETDEGTLYNLAAAGASIKTKYNVGGGVLDLTTQLKNNITVNRGSGDSVASYDLHAAIKNTAEGYYGNYTIADEDILVADGSAVAKYTITVRDFVDSGEGKTVTITVSGNLTYNGEAQEATVTVVDKIASLNPLTRGYLYASATEYNAAKGTNKTDEQFALLTVAEKTKTPGAYYLTFATNTNAGENTATVTVRGMGNYAAGEIAAKTFTINPATLIVTPTLTKVYNGNDALPTLPTDAATKSGKIIKVTSEAETAQFSFQGFVDNTDAENIVIKTTGGSYEAPVLEWVDAEAETDNVGTNYAVQFKNEDINKCFVLANYTFYPAQGVYSITKKALKLKVKEAQSINYGDAENYVLDATYPYGNPSTAVDGDVTDQTLPRAIKITKSANKSTKAGHTDEYELTPAFKTDAEITAEINADDNIAADQKAATIAAIKTTRDNYSLKADDITIGYLTFNKAPLKIGLNEMVYADALEKVYDGQDASVATPTSTADLTIIGLKGTDTVNIDDLTVTVTPKNGNIKDANTYQVVLNGAVNDNYDIQYIPSQYKITRRPLKLTVADQTFVTNAAPTIAFLYKVETIKVGSAVLEEQGIVDGESASDIFKLQFTDAITLDNSNPKKITNVIGDVPNAIEAVLKLDANDNTNYDITTYAQTKGTAHIVAAATIMLDRSSATLATTINSNKGAHKSVAFSSRPMSAETWQAYVLPFDVTPAELCAGGLGYVIVNVLKPASTASNVKFGYTMKTIPAHTPFLMKTSEDTNMNALTLDERTIVQVPAADKIVAQNSTKDVNFYGIYATKTGPFAANEYVMYIAPDNNQWVNNYQYNLSAMSGYLVLPASNTTAPVFTVEDENGTTSILGVTADGRIVEAEGWYTLNGMKLQGIPTKKGIYIHNGKKLVVK